MADSESADGAEVVVIYALPDEQHLIAVAHEPGMTAGEAVVRSGLPQQFPEIADQALVLGLFGQRIMPDQPVQPGARIEICRPLQRDPRELRRIMMSKGLVVGQRDADDR